MHDDTRELKDRNRPRRGFHRRLALWLSVLAGGWCSGGAVRGADEAGPPGNALPDLASMSLEQLVNVEITSVSKHSEKLNAAPAAVFVISGDDIRRSGVTSIPDALRMAPGIEVGRVDAHTWAVSARGFNDTFANKLLVLMDGRSVYTPLFSGTHWDVQDTLLEDIDRIEVVRGPGATLWGANAVNGVINVISKSARDTQGSLVSLGGGTEETGFLGGRYGGQISENTFYRVYGKYFNRDSSELPDGSLADDRWQVGRAGFRLDWDPRAENQFTVQGDVYGGKLDETIKLPTPTTPFSAVSTEKITVAGGNLLGRWTHQFSADSELALQSYYDATYRNTSYLREDRGTFDVDMQHRFALGSRQELIWGAGYRLLHDDLKGSFLTSFEPEDRDSQLFSFFVQDDFTLIRERLRLIVGSKFEHNDFTGFEVQPSGRLLWTPEEHHTVWASVSRAVRTPSRAENDIRLNVGVVSVAPVAVASIYGDPAFKSENLLAYELGYRVQPAKRLSLDVATFYNTYDHLRTAELGVPYPDPTLPGTPFVQPLYLRNKAAGETYGIEVAGNLQLTDWWRLRASYDWLQMQLHRRANSNDASAEGDEGKSPHHQIGLRSSMDLPHHLEFDVTARYVDRLPHFGISSYFAVDVRLAWKPTPNVEFAVVGQNLLDSRHPEFAPDILPTQRTEVQRSVYGKVTFRV